MLNIEQLISKVINRKLNIKNNRFMYVYRDIFKHLFMFGIRPKKKVFNSHLGHANSFSGNLET